jgi:hypothetical protein
MTIFKPKDPGFRHTSVRTSPKEKMGCFQDAYSQMKSLKEGACGHYHRRICPKAHLTACNLPMWITSASNTDHCSTLPDFKMFRSLSAHELSPNTYFLKA